MCPLVPMVVNVICYFPEQETFIPKHTIRFADKGRECVRKRVLVFFGRAKYKSKSCSKIFFVVFALVGNVRRVVYDNIKATIPKRHRSVVRDQSRTVPAINVHPNNWALTALPKSTP